ncbi:MAG: helix-turn-helix domain-containing protein [Pseudomonadota bacterium]
MLTIGKLATATGVKVPTIRYYEQIGLLGEAERTAGNQRRYSAAHRDRLAFIRHARELGFSVPDIAELLRLSAHPDHPCADVERIVRDQRRAVRDRIARLTRLEAELARMEGVCPGGSVADCSVLHALGDHSQCSGAH